ncbi:MAG: Eco57I restriction-modification methylase domain-containing protein [Candidatus Thorarchaeota archaeon]
MEKSDMGTDVREEIREALNDFTKMDLRTASINLLNTLGYRSEKTLDIGNSPEAFLEEFDKRDRPFRKDRVRFDNWKSIDFLFQITDDEVHGAEGQDTFAFDSDYILGNYQSYLFFALDLKKDHYTRTQLADITREINLLFNMPVMMLIQHSETLTFSIIDRHLSKRDQSKDVLEKVKLIKDINYKHPHRAHIEILNDLSLTALISKYDCRSFKQLHEAWRETLDTDKLNKKFYRELASWYFWALDHVEFPADVEEDKATRNATNVIRLLTRLIFCWFLKEKTLIPPELFNQHRLKYILESLNDDESSFYLAILQNLFFGTLNQRMNIDGKENRKFASDGSFNQRKREYGVKNLYRYQKLFSISEKEAVDFFSTIPFLNGGLFDCLDKEDKAGKVIYVDGFTRNPKKRPEVPNFLFFSDYRTVDLSDAYGDKRRKKEKVRGLIRLLDSYKFTVTENTPIEEEIALDPELLGKVFENLLASYNPETGTTARKQTGSFYTPREIVNYMVDESLIAYLETRFKDSNIPLEGNLQDQLRELFAYTEEPHPFKTDQVENIIDAINNCKILDPACGSGAFPMGILHKLVFILNKLDPNNELWKEKQISKAEQIPDVSAREIAVGAIEKDFETNDLDYGRKLYLIENCIYGVDIQPIAIQISKLRFFISLICNQRPNQYRDQNRGIRPLPNLETKFVAANTLIPIDREPYQGFLTDPRLPKLERKLATVRHKHFAAQRRRDKLNLQEQDSKIREEIASILEESNLTSEASKMLAAWDPYDQNTSAPFFDPDWMYGITDGFDIVIGNPPYVRIQTLRRQDPAQVKLFKEYYEAAKKGNYDLYVVFVECGLDLLSKQGHLAYILPHKFFNAKYGEPLRKLISDGQHLRHVVHFGDQQIFPGVTNYVCLMFLEKAGSEEMLFVQVDTLTEWLSTYRGIKGSIQARNITSLEWNFIVGPDAKVFEHLETIPHKLEDASSRIYQGPITSADSVFLFKKWTAIGEVVLAYSKELDQQVELEPSIMKSVVRSGDIGRYYAKPEALVLFPYEVKKDRARLFAVNEFRNRFPKAWDYLCKNRKVLESRERGSFKDDEWYRFGRTQNLGLWEQPKLMVPYMVTNLACYYDSNNHYYFVNVTTGGYGITSNGKFGSLSYLCGLLNSRLEDFYLKKISSNFQGGYFAANKQFIEKLPIPSASKEQQAVIEQLACYMSWLYRPQIKIEEQHSRNPLMFAFWEQVLNALVYELFFPEELHASGLHFFDLLADVFLPDLNTIQEDKRLSMLSVLFEKLYDVKNPLYAALYSLRGLDLVRVIEGEV